MSRYNDLKGRLEKIAYVSPTNDGNSVLYYLYLAGEAHNLLKKLKQLMVMDTFDDVEYDFLKSEISLLEEKVKAIS